MSLYKDPVEKRMKPRCIMCSGEIEPSNLGSICNACRDRMRATG